MTSNVVNIAANNVALDSAYCQLVSDRLMNLAADNEELLPRVDKRDSYTIILWLLQRKYVVPCRSVVHVERD